MGKDVLDQDLSADDFYTWNRTQADALRRQNLQALDFGNLAEELERLGRSEEAALESSYRLICMHRLNMMMQPERATRCWRATVVRERLDAERTRRRNPGLKAKRDELLRAAYADTRKEAAAETGLAVAIFPVTLALTRKEAVDESFCPLRSTGAADLLRRAAEDPSMS